MRNLIIIVNWNNRLDTEICLKSIKDFYHSDYKLMIIDNGSSETDWLNKYEHEHEWITILYNDENIGFTPATNQGFDFAMRNGFEYVTLINNDARVTNDFLHNLREIINDHRPHMISCKIIKDNGSNLLDNVGHRMINTGEIVPIGHDEPAELYNRYSENIGSCAAATSYSMKLIRNAGLYDPFFKTGYEDAEYGLRATVLGYSSQYFPELIVYHKVSSSVKRIDDFSYRVNQQVNIYYTYFKLMPSAVILMNLPFIFIKYVLVILIELLLLRFRYVKIHLLTIKKLYSIRKIILKSRQEFHAAYTLISSFVIMRKQSFFLWYDLKRLWQFTIGRKRNVFDNSLDKNSQSG